MLETIIFTTEDTRERRVLGLDSSHDLQALDRISVIAHTVIWRNHPDAHQSVGVGNDASVRLYMRRRDLVASLKATDTEVTIEAHAYAYDDLIILQKFLSGEIPFDEERFRVLFPGDIFPLAEEKSKWVMLVNEEGYFGRRRDVVFASFDERFGADNWTHAHVVNNTVISHEQTLSLFEEAYHNHLREYPDVLEWLVKTASDVYDTNISNTRSGLMYQHQEDSAHHYQDIALRRVLKRLGRAFEGERLVQVRSTSSDSHGVALSPLNVLFHCPSIIEQVAMHQVGRAGSTEDFYRKNSVILVNPDALSLAVHYVGSDGAYLSDGQRFYHVTFENSLKLVRVSKQQMRTATAQNSFRSVLGEQIPYNVLEKWFL